MKTIFLAIAFILTALTLSAKTPSLSFKEQASPPPRIIRTCCSFGSDVGMIGVPFVKWTDITCLADLGKHSYLGNKEEANGIIYTERGGFIDLGHLRDCADWTAYLATVILTNQSKEEDYKINLGIEGGRKTLTIDIPNDLNRTSVFQLAGKIAYDLSLWHEISTWFGASFIPLVPERYSSFSPEDLYSNFLGVSLAIQALSSELEYEDAMTQLIESKMKELIAVTTVSETYDAMEKVEGIWWTRKKRLPSKKILLKRYFDSELSLQPWLIPREKSNEMPVILSKDNNDITDLYMLEIKLNYKFPLRHIYPEKKDRIITQKDFDTMQSFIKRRIKELEQKVAYREKRRKKNKKLK
jgi:hypothetical protein